MADPILTKMANDLEKQHQKMEIVTFPKKLKHPKQKKITKKLLKT